MKLQKGDNFESLLQFKEAVADWAIENTPYAQGRATT
jgi:hypothetical protein